MRSGCNTDSVRRGPRLAFRWQDISEHEGGVGDVADPVDIGELGRLEEQSYLGIDPEAQTDYGIEPGAENRALDEVRRAAGVSGVSVIAREADLSRQYVSDIVGGNRRPSEAVLSRLVKAARLLETVDQRGSRSRQI